MIVSTARWSASAAVKSGLFLCGTFWDRSQRIISTRWCKRCFPSTGAHIGSTWRDENWASQSLLRYVHLGCIRFRVTDFTLRETTRLARRARSFRAHQHFQRRVRRTYPYRKPEGRGEPFRYYRQTIMLSQPREDINIPRRRGSCLPGLSLSHDDTRRVFELKVRSEDLGKTEFLIKTQWTAVRIAALTGAAETVDDPLQEATPPTSTSTWPPGRTARDAIPRMPALPITTQRLGLHFS